MRRLFPRYGQSENIDPTFTLFLIVFTRSAVIKFDAEDGFFLPRTAIDRCWISAKENEPTYIVQLFSVWTIWWDEIHFVRMPDSWCFFHFSNSFGKETISDDHGSLCGAASRLPHPITSVWISVILLYIRLRWKQLMSVKRNLLEQFIQESFMSIVSNIITKQIRCSLTQFSFDWIVLMCTDIYCH